MKNTIIIVIIVAVIAFTVGLYVGDTYGTGVVIGTKVVTKEMGDYKNTFDDGWEAAKKKLEESGSLITMPSGEIRTLSGEIVKAAGNKITFSTSLLNPLDDEKLKTRTAIVTNQTEISLYRFKTEEEKEKERAESSGELGDLRLRRDSLAKEVESCSPATPEGEDSCAENREELNELQSKIMNLEMNTFDGYSKIEGARVSDIKEGYLIIIEASENISKNQEFEVIKIEVREKIKPEVQEELPAETPTE